MGWEGRIHRVVTAWLSAGGSFLTIVVTYSNSSGTPWNEYCGWAGPPGSQGGATRGSVVRRACRIILRLRTGVPLKRGHPRIAVLVD